MVLHIIAAALPASLLPPWSPFHHCSLWCCLTFTQNAGCPFSVSLGFYTLGPQNLASLQRSSLIPSSPSLACWLSREVGLATKILHRLSHSAKQWLICLNVGFNSQTEENICGFCVFRFPQPSCLDQGATAYFSDIGKSCRFQCHFGSVCWCVFLQNDTGGDFFNAPAEGLIAFIWGLIKGTKHFSTEC